MCFLCSHIGQNLQRKEVFFKEPDLLKPDNLHYEVWPQLRTFHGKLFLSVANMHTVQLNWMHSQMKSSLKYWSLLPKMYYSFSVLEYSGRFNLLLTKILVGAWGWRNRKTSSISHKDIAKSRFEAHEIGNIHLVPFMYAGHSMTNKFIVKLVPPNYLNNSKIIRLSKCVFCIWPFYWEFFTTL